MGGQGVGSTLTVLTTSAREALMDASSEEWQRESANLASIPEANRQEFYEYIIDLSGCIKRIYHYPKNTDAEVIAAAVAVRAAREAVDALSPKQAAELAHAMDLGPSWVLDYERDALTLIGIVEGAFNVLTGRRLYDVAGKRWRPKGSTAANDFRFFVRQLLLIVHSLGGRLTFNPKKFDPKKDRGGGTLVDVLRCLRPAFPQGLIPEPADLPLKTIGQICTREASARRTQSAPPLSQP
jgi:hypothetical protein